jgi:transcription initiation factor TFIIB
MSKESIRNLDMKLLELGKERMRSVMNKKEICALDRIATTYLRLPEDVREAAALMYRKCVEKGLTRGRLIESVVSAVLYATCRDYGIPRTLDEIAKISGIPKKEIGRHYRFITHELDLHVPLTDPTHYVPRFTAALNLSGSVQDKAIELLKTAISKGLISGRGPTGVAAEIGRAHV